MPSRRKIDSPAGGLGSPAVVSQASGADTGAADAAPLLPDPRAEAQDSEAPALSFGSAVQPLLDPPSVDKALPKHKLALAFINKTKRRLI